MGGGVQEGEVTVRPEPGSGGAYQGGPLSTTIDSQAPASGEQQVEWLTLFAHLTALGKWHALLVGGGLVRSTRPGSKILIGDSAASIHCSGDSALLYNKRSPAPDKNYSTIGDGKRLVEYW